MKLPSTSSGPLHRADAGRWAARAPPPADRIELHFPPGPVFVLDESADGGDLFVLPGDPASADDPESPSSLKGKGRCWVLPQSAESQDRAWLIEADDRSAGISARFERDEDASSATTGLAPVVGVTVIIACPNALLTPHRARPHADVHGAAYTLSIDAGPELSDALAGFYWGTILPCVVERTRARHYPDRDGFVVSMLAPDPNYRGTYPDVDHEFQIKARLAMGSATDLAVVRRMIELQLRVMREDPQALWRDPCAVQPDGTREYHVRRSSLDGTQNAVMFLVTGNVEVVESVSFYVSRTGDRDWLARILPDLEGAVSCVEGCVDPLGRLWSDVYYEDQVIKDGRETMSQALAARSFVLLADLETSVGRADRAGHYASLGRRLRAALCEPLPLGYWDPHARRFVDWVDRAGAAHDHIHLLANELPLTLNHATPSQTDAVLSLLEENHTEFQRFPTFVAARIQDYTESEMGVAGPYDLCAAGRYWCWDAAFWSSRGRGDVLLRQLQAVARMARPQGWVMGERYDMHHVYYTDPSTPPWHGAAHYYEYPCVFAWVLLAEYLGVGPPRWVKSGASLRVAPRLVSRGLVTLGQAAYQLRYEFRPEEDRFTLTNLASEPRTFELDLVALFPRAQRSVVRLGDEGPETDWDCSVPVRLEAGSHLTVRFES